MGLNFEGSTDNISERQLTFIKEVLEKRGYNNTIVTIDPVGAAGDNYVANVIRITVSDENGIFKMIAKLAPQNEIKRATTNTQLVFKNEHRMYTEILPKFQELEVKMNVPDEDRFRFAECYGSLLEVPNEVILLEDLQMSDFIMLDRFKPLADECVKSILRNFAILHSLSFALKNTEPDTFKYLKSDLFDMWASMAAIPQILTHFSRVEKDVEVMLESEDYKRVVRGAIINSLALAVKLSKTEVDNKHSVIQQGDSWTNNIMFKFNGDELHQSVMIDYQLSKESSPARDILYMIFNCTDHKTRLERYNDWIDYYHSELDKKLENFGLKANNVYSRDQLDADIKRYARMMFGLSVLFVPILTMQSKDAQKIKDAMESINIHEDRQMLDMTNFDNSYALLCSTRIRDLIDSYQHFGLL